MEALFVTLAKHADQLGTISILLFVIAGMSWAIRHLYLSDKKCETARLEDSEERGEMKKEIATLNGKVDAMQQLHQQHLATLINTNHLKDPTGSE